MSAPTQQPWRLNSVSQPLAAFRPVLAVTLVRRRADADGVDVLTAVRTAAANETHPGVVSVPTIRVPETLAQSWLDALDDGSSATAASNGDVLREVGNLLARKLGVADALELRDIELRPVELGAWQGTSVLGEDDNGLVTEDLTMFNVCVEVTNGADGFPLRTASYHPIVWARSEDFLRMVRTREVAALNADLDEILFCVYGLCLETAARILGSAAIG